MRSSTSASQACGSMALSLAVSIRVNIAAARSPPRSEPANNQDLRPIAIPRSARSAALLVRQMRPSPAIIEFAEPGIGIGLQNAGPARKVAPRMFATAVARVEEQGRRRVMAAKWPVVAHVGPQPPRDGLVLRQHVVPSCRRRAAG